MDGKKSMTKVVLTAKRVSPEGSPEDSSSEAKRNRQSDEEQNEEVVDYTDAI